MGKEQIKVQLVEHMGSDLSTVNSARVSFDKESDWGYVDFGVPYPVMELKEGDKKLVKYLADHRHMTPFRHNAIKLRCSMPIFLARQLGKHQVGLTLNEVSRRYVDTPPDFFTPDEWRGRPEGSIKQGSSGVIHQLKNPTIIECPVSGKGRADIDHEYQTYIQYAIGLYEDMLESGVAPEMARMVLPQAMMTEWIWTGNLLSFAHVYKERIASGAQLEAQWFAEMLDTQIRPLFPVSWSALVD